MDFFVFARTSGQTWPVCRAGAAPAGIATEKKMCYNRNIGIDCLLLLRKGELRSVEWKEMLQGIRERDPRAAKALFEEKGARLYHAFYLASGDYGAARSQAKEAFSSLLRRIRQAPEDGVDPARLEQWMEDLTKGGPPFRPPLRLPPCRFREASEESSPLALCLASFPEQPLPPETQRLLTFAPSAPLSSAQTDKPAPLSQTDEPTLFPQTHKASLLSQGAVPPQPPQAAGPFDQDSAGPHEAGREEIRSEFLSHYQETARRKQPKSPRIWPWLLLAALSAALLLLIWAILGLCMSMGWIPRADLGYSWFNQHVWPLF